MLCMTRLYKTVYKRRKLGEEQNDDVKKYMSTDYLNTYGETLFEES